MKNTKQLEYVKRTQRNRSKKSDMNRKVWYRKEYVRAGCNSWVKEKSMAKRSARMIKEVWDWKIRINLPYSALLFLL